MIVSILLPCLAVTGCGRPGPIEVDLTATPVRFIINHHGWPRPFWWPRVTEFAVASSESEAGELLWQLESTSVQGELAHRLAFVYGRVPPGFTQVYPGEAQPPEQPETGRVYYVAAGGQDSLYRMAFSLPLTLREAEVQSRGPRP